MALDAQLLLSTSNQAGYERGCPGKLARGGLSRQGRIMKEVAIVVFGTDALMESSRGIAAKCASPGQSRTMREEAGLLREALVKNFGEAIKFRYVDTRSDEMAEFPQYQNILEKIRLPLTVIADEPKFQGGFPFDMIAEAVYRLLK